MSREPNVDEVRTAAARLARRQRSLERQAGLRVDTERDFPVPPGAPQSEADLLLRLTEAVSRAQTLADRLQRLQRVTAGLSRAASVRDIARVVVTEGLAATGALTGGLWLIDEAGTGVELLHDVGYRDDGRRDFQRLDLEGSPRTPLVDAILRGEALWVASRAELQRLYPELAAHAAVQEDQAIVCVPFVAGGRPVGALSFTFDTAVAFDQPLRDFLLTVAHQGELALERARLYERERAAREEAEAAQRRASFKAEASAVLASSLDYATTLRNLAKLAVPRFADWCVVELADPSGPTTVVAAEHVDASKLDLVWKLRELAPAHADALLDVSAVLRSGKALMKAEIGDDPFEGITSEGAPRDLARALGLRSAITVPMLVHGRTIGVMSFVWAESNRRYTDADLETAVMLGQRAAFAVDHARLHGDLQRAVVARDDLIAVVSHDLRNLLGVMAMSVQGIAKKLPDGAQGERAQRLAGALKRTTIRMERLIRDLLDFGSIESGRLKLEPQLEDLGAFFGQLADDLRPLAAAKAIRLEVASPSAPLSIRCDRQRVFQVLSNLVGNAVKFTPNGGAILVDARAEENDVVLGVHDSGPGVDAAHQPRIFDRYYQGESREAGGVGLGLYIARGIVEAHGGRIWVESVRGEGSHFYFTLPRATESEPAR
jgi:signal transduction histidine kinase